MTAGDVGDLGRSKRQVIATAQLLIDSQHEESFWIVEALLLNVLLRRASAEAVRRLELVQPAAPPEPWTRTDAPCAS